MTDLEHVLGPRLNDLADYLTEPVGTVPAGAAIARYRRQRRTRAALAAVAAAVALIAVGVPTAMSTLGAGSSSHGATAGTPSPSSAPPSTPVAAPTENATAESAAESAAKEALGKAALQALIAVRVPEPLRLTAPADWGTCPKASVLSSAGGTPWVYWQGQLPGGPNGCQYLAADGGAGTVPATRESVGIGFLEGTSVTQMQAGVASADSAPGNNCVSTLVSESAILQRCEAAGELRYYLTVPDSGGAGIWVLSVLTGDQYSGDPGMALQAVVFAAEDAFRG